MHLFLLSPNLHYCIVTFIIAKLFVALKLKQTTIGVNKNALYIRFRKFATDLAFGHREDLRNKEIKSKMTKKTGCKSNFIKVNL